MTLMTMSFTETLTSYFSAQNKDVSDNYKGISEQATNQIKHLNSIPLSSFLKERRGSNMTSVRNEPLI